VSRSGNGEICALFSSSSENPLDGATVVWLQDGLFNARIGTFQAGPVLPSTRVRRNRRDSCEKPVQMVVWSTMVWLAGGQASQEHLTTHSARPVVGRGHKARASLLALTPTTPAAHDLWVARRFSNDAYFGVFPTWGRSEKSSPINNSLLSERNEKKFASCVLSKTSAPRETACPQASRDWNTRPPCRIVIKVIVPTGQSVAGCAD